MPNAEEVVVLGASTLAFVYLYKHTGVGCQSKWRIFRIFYGNGSVTHDPSSSLNTDTEGKVEKKKIVSLLRVSAQRTAAWSSAPINNTSLGLMLLLGSLPMKKLETSLTIRGYEWH